MPKIAASLTALVLLAIPARGDDLANWWKNYRAGAHLVSLPDGRKLSLYCEGRGSPVVMMEAGLSGATPSWRKVQTAIGKRTKTCAYDRAGYWDSPPATGPHDAGAEADDLAALLKAAKLPAPYVIVAHSYGGYIARLYAGRHLQDVAGLVLIDPSSEHQNDRFAKAQPSPASVKMQEDAAAQRKACAAEPRPAELAQKCLRALPADMPPELAGWYNAAQTPAWFRLIGEEGAGMAGVSSQLLDQEKKSLGAIPFILLNRDPTQPFPEAAPEDSARAQALWLQMHVETMDLSSDSQLRVVPHAGHNIQNDRPDAVIAAVTDVVVKARKRRTD
ncbi:MAG: alpha/beta hydrolase [Alphaproteobacteria bacterium]|nr:alpha/beta hydrolase [Alphaproteobacteria bacterium]